jgi:hypothetical protein
LSFPADKATSRVSGGSSVFSTSFFQRSACSARGSRSHDRRVRRKTRSFPAHKSFRLAFCRRSYKIEHTSGACLSSTSFFANSPARRIPGRNRRSRTGSRTPACGSAGRSNRERHHPPESKQRAKILGPVYSNEMTWMDRLRFARTSKFRRQAIPNSSLGQIVCHATAFIALHAQ